jgi:hypothetical protein
MDADRVLITAADRCSHRGPGATVGGVTTYPGREQNWYPISKLGWFTGHIREGITVTRRQLELLQPARSQPYLLDEWHAITVVRPRRPGHGRLPSAMAARTRRRDPGMRPGRLRRITRAAARPASRTALLVPWACPFLAVGSRITARDTV